MFDLSLDLFIQKQFWHFVRLSSVYLFKRMSLHYTYLLKSTDFNSMYVSPNIFKVLSTTVFVFETETERLLSLVGLNLHPDLRCKKQSKYGWEKNFDWQLVCYFLYLLSTKNWMGKCPLWQPSSYAPAKQYQQFVTYLCCWQQLCGTPFYGLLICHAFQKRR